MAGTRKVKNLFLGKLGSVKWNKAKADIGHTQESYLSSITFKLGDLYLLALVSSSIK